MNISSIVARLVFITRYGSFHVAEYTDLREAFDTYVAYAGEGFNHIELHSYGALEPMSYTYVPVVAEFTESDYDNSPLAEWEQELL